MLFYRLKANPTAAAGTWAVKLSAMLPSAYVNRQPSSLVFPPMMMRQMYVKAATAGNTYDLTITDFEGVEIRKFTDISQVYNDLTETPIVGDITFTVTGSDFDEAFTLLVIVQDDR